MANTTEQSKTAAEAAAAGTEAFANAASIGREALEQSVKMGAFAAARLLRSATAAGTEQAELARTMREKFAAGTNGNLGALTDASEAFIAGTEAYTDKLIEYTRAAATEGIEMFDRALAAKTPNDLLELQLEMGVGTMRRAVAQTGELGGIVADTVTRTFEPIKSRYDSVIGQASEEEAKA